MPYAVLNDLASLNRKALMQLHRNGNCPRLEALNGRAQGRILDSRVLQAIGVWRGKEFHCSPDGTVVGMNRIGFGPVVLERYRFSARVAPSAFGAQKVVFIDHDNARNPGWVRRFHDELVQVGSGLYLGCSHLKINGQLKYAGYFALQFN